MIVVKVGGSLFPWPPLLDRLAVCLASLRKAGPLLLVPGGGAVADCVRRLDREHGLGEERSHRLAIRALDFNADCLGELVPGTEVVADLARCARVWRNGGLPILAPARFLDDDDGRPGALPHLWAVTSDSIAARVARVAGADGLVLLKSAGLPAGTDRASAARRGWVDPYFPEASRGLNGVGFIPLRDDPTRITPLPEPASENSG